MTERLRSWTQVVEMSSCGSPSGGVSELVTLWPGNTLGSPQEELTQQGKWNPISSEEIA